MSKSNSDSKTTSKTTLTSIIINVGGEIFVIGVDNLLKEPDCLLNKILEGRYHSKDPEGITPFFDRDAKSFIFIHDYLRGYDIEWKEIPLFRLKRIANDAQFFNMTNLQQILSKYVKVYDPETKDKETEQSFNDLRQLSTYFQLIMKGLGVNKECQEIYQGLINLIENSEEAKNLVKEAMKTSYHDYKKNPDSEVMNKLFNMLMGQFAVSMIRSMFPNNTK
jgi:hypothetical protein